MPVLKDQFVYRLLLNRSYWFPDLVNHSTASNPVVPFHAWSFRPSHHSWRLRLGQKLKFDRPTFSGRGTCRRVFNGSPTRASDNQAGYGMARCSSLLEVKNRLLRSRADRKNPCGMMVAISLWVPQAFCKCVGVRLRRVIDWKPATTDGHMFLTLRQNLPESAYNGSVRATNLASVSNPPAHARFKGTNASDLNTIEQGEFMFSSNAAR